MRRLDELGWIEDRTVAIEYRWAEGRNERLAEIAAEFVQRNARRPIAATCEGSHGGIRQKLAA